MNIYVSNLSFNTSNEDLAQEFARFGEVSSANIIMDKYTNRSKGFAFVEMPDEAAANEAISQLNGATVNGRQLNVNEARPREERAPRSNY